MRTKTLSEPRCYFRELLCVRRSKTHWCLIYVKHSMMTEKTAISSQAVFWSTGTKKSPQNCVSNLENSWGWYWLILVYIFCEGSLDKCVDIFFLSLRDEKRDLRTYFKTLQGSFSQFCSGFYCTAGCGSFHSGRLFYDSYLKQNFSQSLWKIHFKLICFGEEEQLIQSSASVFPQVGVTYVTGSKNKYQIYKYMICSWK